MQLTDPVSLVLRQKRREILSISPQASVFDALSLMADHDVGALLVVSGNELNGIITERDYARKVILLGKASRETDVSEIMAEPFSVAPDTTIDECMRRMTANRVRYLLVLDHGDVMGVVSIGDLVNWIISAQEETIQQLHAYVSGSYPG